MLDSNYLDAIKKFEGYASKATWDYAQHSNGYGTRAAFPGEVIDKAEAERRFAGEIRKAAEFVESVAPDLDSGSKAALTSLTYNAGRTWATSGLGDAIASGDMDKARSLFLQYNKAGGSTLDGLVQRRLQEVAWFGEGQQAAAPFTTAMAEQPSAVSAASTTKSVEAPTAGAVVPPEPSVAQRAVANQAPMAGSLLAPEDQAASRAFSRAAGDPVLMSLLEQLGKAHAARKEPDAERQRDTKQTAV
ncbi:glycoside hydrolase family 24 [Hyphomicrobium methylovorum]|uniref:lysozyme n=1 Tax=Hyphomicrobium methylovorum TaxID=84 RepID=UPI0015E65315|nr:glycoside hydrolase family protein [Hyphomicrobium methylovorum]MBA2125966.1 glycoside hydrolase family 24 [Hyphomicrobium methylovorum]